MAILTVQVKHVRGTSAVRRIQIDELPVLADLVAEAGRAALDIGDELNLPLEGEQSDDGERDS